MICLCNLSRHLHPLLLCFLSSAPSASIPLSPNQTAMPFLSLRRLSVGEVKRSRAEKRKKKTSRTTGNKNSRPGLSYNNMALLGSKASPKSQALLCSFLSLSLCSAHLFAFQSCHQHELSPLPICFLLLSIYLTLFIFNSSHSSSVSSQPGLPFVVLSPLSLWYSLSFHLSLFLPLS